MTLYDYIAIWITIISTLLVLSIICYLNTKNKIHKLNISLNTQLDETINTTLDTLIKSCFDEYIIFNQGYKKRDYISADDEKKITSDLGTMVSKRISETMYNKLSQYYNAKAIPEVISNKIYMIVIDYSLSVNSIKNKSNKK